MKNAPDYIHSVQQFLECLQKYVENPQKRAECIQKCVKYSQLDEKELSGFAKNLFFCGQNAPLSVKWFIQ